MQRLIELADTSQHSSDRTYPNSEVCPSPKRLQQSKRPRCDWIEKTIFKPPLSVEASDLPLFSEVGR